ncbi:ABC transporter substrate-binding protein [Metabacillus iocasae]|uniref:Spermidine/putrescine transport system substrate-binding protein n=1 Tax=Priestia iocasae TaxID=2291674 RepID=A0ABS2QU34_9BACI|nr:ABC transporter substrate-binding protein [Metabacillus iocasae]MBM7702432.1 putative spermidine/putrescine transport system substrate-binding protein [Metabacillus iocasae]
MKKLWMMLSLLLFLAGCQPSDKQVSNKELLKKEWNEIESLAEGSEVNLFMWGGDPNINQYIDEWVAPRLKEEHDITLNRQPVDTPTFMQKLLTEKKAGKQEGSIDVMWINGENFKLAKEEELLYGSFAEKLPSYKYVDKESGFTEEDAGTSIDGLEAPWGKVQFVLYYDSAKVKNPPKTMKQLSAWVKENPGLFTYPNPTDFTGNAFLRQFVYEQNQTPSGDVEKDTAHIWSFLTEIEPYLWRKGNTYPESLEQLDQLYSRGEVQFTFGFNEARAESLIKNGMFPATTQSYVLDAGSIGNAHYLSIPFNVKNPAGAMVAVHFLQSPEAQLAKLQPENWGEGTVVSSDSLEDEMKAAFLDVDRGDSVLPAEELEKAFKPDLDASYIEYIKEKWKGEVLP